MNHRFTFPTARASVDVLFDSVARHAGTRADGANGLLNMLESGAATIAQDRDSCVVYGMPKVAVDLGAAQHNAPPADIPSIVMEILRRRSSSLATVRRQ